MQAEKRVRALEDAVREYHVMANQLQLIPITAKRAAGVHYEIKVNPSAQSAADMVSPSLACVGLRTNHTDFEKWLRRNGHLIVPRCVSTCILSAPCATLLQESMLPSLKGVGWASSSAAKSKCNLTHEPLTMEL